MKRFLLVVAILLSASAWSITVKVDASAKSHENITQTSKPTDTRISNVTPDARTAAQVNESVKAPPENQAEIAKEARKNKKEFNEALTAWATAALAVVTLFLAIFTGFLWASTSRLVRAEQKSSKEDLRAYLRITPESFLHNPSNGDNVVQFEVKNTGRTPATNIRVSGHLVILPANLPKELTIDYESGVGAAPGVLFSNERFQSNASIGQIVRGLFVRNSSNDLSEYINPQSTERLHFICSVTYLDIFDQEHETRYACNIFRRSTADGKNHLTQFSLAPFGNELLTKNGRKQKRTFIQLVLEIFRGRHHTA